MLDHEDIFVGKVQDPLITVPAEPEELAYQPPANNPLDFMLMKKNGKDLNGFEGYNEKFDGYRDSRKTGGININDVARKSSSSFGSSSFGNNAEYGNSFNYSSQRGGTESKTGKPGLQRNIERSNRPPGFTRNNSISGLNRNSEETNSVKACTCHIKSALLCPKHKDVVAKKDSLQRSSTDTSSGLVSGANIANTFLPNWRSNGGDTDTSNNNANTVVDSSTKSSEWRTVGSSNPDASKTWRSDTSLKGKNKDGKEYSVEPDDNAVEYVQRKRNAAQPKSTKPFSRRFDMESSELFKTAFDPLSGEPERDFFASGRSNASGYGPNFDSFGNQSSGRGKQQGPPGFNRFKGYEFSDGRNYNKSYQERSGGGQPNNRYPYRNQNKQLHSYDNDEMGSDDDFRRGSLPEWSLDDSASVDITKVGTFGADGEFHEIAADDSGSLQNDEPESETKLEKSIQEMKVGLKIKKASDSEVSFQRLTMEEQTTNRVTGTNQTDKQTFFSLNETETRSRGSLMAWIVMHF